MLGKSGRRPVSVIGTYNANDINYVIDYLAGLVKKSNISPKKYWFMDLPTQWLEIFTELKE